VVGADGIMRTRVETGLRRLLSTLYGTVRLTPVCPRAALGHWSG